MAADRWGARATADEKKLTPEQFQEVWQRVALKMLRGEPLATEQGPYYVRCGRTLGGGKLCLLRLGHAPHSPEHECSPNFANICDAPLPKDKRCVLTVGHRGKCMPHFPGR